MTVKELIARLQEAEIDQDIDVVIEYSGVGDFVLHGSGEEADIKGVVNLDTRVVISVME